MAVTRIWDADNGQWQLVGGSVVGLPVGAIVAFAGASPPIGYLFCNGAAIDRIEYSTLFETIGTIFGAGNGTTTFNLPNLSDRFPIGKAAGTALGAVGGAKGHGHAQGGHGHGWGATSDNHGAHGHYVDVPYTETGFMSDVIYAGAAGTAVPVGDHKHAEDVSPFLTSTDNGIHAHNVSGTTDNGNGGTTGPSDPPFQVVNFIIHATDAANIGPEGPEGPEGPPGPEGIGFHVVDPVEPVAPDDGLMWTDTSTGISQIWDGDNAEWIIVGTGAGGGGGDHVVDPTEPVAPSDGLLWVDPDEIAPVGLSFGDLLTDAKGSTDTPDDLFPGTTLNGKWTVVTGAAGTVNLIDNADPRQVYQVDNGKLRIQVGNADSVLLRQDYTLPDNRSMVMAVEIPYIGQAGDNADIGLALNTNDASVATVESIHAMAEQDTAEWVFQGTVDAGATTNSFEILDHTLAGELAYFRITRSGLVYRSFASLNRGRSWTFLGTRTATTAFNNVWIRSGGSALPTAGVNPIFTVYWVQEGGVGVDPW